MTENVEKTHILDLINAVQTKLPVRSVKQAQALLGKFTMSDRCALVSAAYLGEIRAQCGVFLPDDEPVDRYYIASDIDGVGIGPDKHAEYFFNKAEALAEYYDNFLRCAKNSGYDLANF